MKELFGIGGIALPLPSLFSPSQWPFGVDLRR